MKTEVAVAGQKLRVEFALPRWGSPLNDFQALDDTARAALLNTMRILADKGRVSNKELFKKVEGTDLWEVKRRQHRFLGFYLPDQRFVIGAYEKKKRNQLKGATIERAERVQTAMLEMVKKEVAHDSQKPA